MMEWNENQSITTTTAMAAATTKHTVGALCVEACECVMCMRARNVPRDQIASVSHIRLMRADT